MEFVHAKHMSFRYDTQTENLLDDISFRLDSEGKIGLVGDNGSGKTTLLDLIRGRLTVSSGSLQIRNAITIGYLPQEVRLAGNATVDDYLWQARADLDRIRRRMAQADEGSLAHADVLAEFYKMKGDAFAAYIDKILAGFEIECGMRQVPISSLSGGEKTKIALAKVLLDNPDIMLLDEPTNHLEISSLEWLEEYLREQSAPYVVVSHDRRFLDNSVTEIWELHDGKLTVYSGDYSFFREQKELHKKQMQKRYEHQQHEIDRLREAAGKRRQEAARMETFKFRRSVTKTGRVCKRDAGSGRSGISSAAKMRSAKAVERRIEAMLEKEKAEKPRRIRKRKVTLSSSAVKSRILMRAENLAKTFNGREIFKQVSFPLRRGAKLGIIGRNGSGKTTLLRIMTGILDASVGSVTWNPQARLGYFSQEHETLTPSRTVLDEVLQGKHSEQTRARHILGRLNIRLDQVHQTIDTLSLGERSKVALAKILFSEANVLLLDEPTNHIELSAREAIEDALEAYDGAVVIASHDRFLLDRIATEIYDIEKQYYFRGTYADYVADMGR